ncbi:ABC transporter permease [Flavilitoribacter nigricans]|uniref:ABC transporter permease n=1 Tax=Flavilitoribacter nigricans (strain ATCC 23147 / DSM 23189 / NBRC 102662 / NCIMB 1420 / SS-2) TaxID=1122177 RepID=A0A2D0N1I6_FLAN2|nr:ABC transporter permease [Flavilitoribacter nigricans]PHN02248.1 hypothetical protein CRP01_32630 [Flavilitoribacter nigricans DSM 23189 = NBRC 102662]
MLKNYLKIALRSFRKQKLTSAINIIGLSIGIACAGLGFVFIQHELSYDRFHDESEKIYWLSASIQNKINISSTPAPLSPELAANFPEVSEAFRLENHDILVRSGNEFFREEAHFVDPNFFSFFSFELVEGTPDHVFDNTNAIVLSAEMARKYFGRLSPVGKTLTVNYRGQEEVFEVSGVAADPPQNSSQQYQFLLPLRFLYREKPDALAGDWGSFPATSFIRLRETADLSSMEAKLPGFIDEKVNTGGEDDRKLLFNLMALKNYHLRDNYRANGLTPPADMSYLRILGLIAGLILLVACFNFMNLSNARGSGRLTEVGVRRVMGAVRGQLVGQFLSEAILMSLISLILGVGLIELALPFIGEITGTALQINWLDPGVLLPLLAISGTTGVLAGMYPALLLSRLKAVQSFQSNFKTGGNNLVTKGSLIFQFALSIGLLSCTLIMYQQQQFIKNQNLGFNQEEVVVIPTQISYQDAEASQRLVEQYRNELSQQPGIVQVSGVSNSFNKGNSAVFVEEEDGSQIPVFFYNTDATYIPLLDIELSAGRNFADDSESNGEQGVIVNETFLKQFAIEGSVEEYRLPEKFRGMANSRILGVVKDFNYMDLKSDVRPLILQAEPDAHLGYLLVKVRPGSVDQTLAQLRTSWQKISPDKPFEFSFLDDDIQQQYLTEARWNKAITGATLLAILIACLGLFGLIALILTERTKEIGIRKILGASIPDITWLISRQFVILLTIAAIFAIPAAWWVMEQWLENFAYKINIQALIFIGAVGITLIIALLTTSLQSARAAMSNPVDALRQE